MPQIDGQVPRTVTLKLIRLPVRHQIPLVSYSNNGWLPVVFIGYELENGALDTFQSQNTPDSIKALLHDIESEMHNPASVVRYHDSDNSTHKFICCFADLRERAYTSKELDAIPIPAEFARVPERVKTRGEIRRVFAPNAMVISYGRDGKTRVDADVVIGLASSDLGDA
ncbi:hypothetical protein BDZ97DRAFT_1924885 [Flammula alnicola]|nr:hypothetical protein BDZ97DRAFT_1924885 [Flammula alnicola]